MAYIDNLHLRFPCDYVAFSRGFTSTHRGVDVAWNSSKGGPNMPVMAPADGKIVALVDGKPNTWPSGSDWGNYIKIDHGNSVYTLMAHIKSGSFAEFGSKMGQSVQRGQALCRMNNSGNSNGSHLHFEVYNGGAGASYRADPLKYCFVWPGQTTNAAADSTYHVKYYTPPASVHIGTPVTRNTGVEQVEITVSNLRARKRPEVPKDNDEVILGYVVAGIYNILETRDMRNEASNGYLWYRIGEYLADPVWCAFDRSWAIYHPEQSEDYPSIIAGLNLENAMLKEALTEIRETATSAIK